MSTAATGFQDREGGDFLFDFEDFERMAQAGVFSRAQGSVELIEGKIRHMAPISADHGEVSGNAAFALKSRLGRAGLGHGTFRVIVHATLKIGEHSAPEPDVFVTKPFGHKYGEAKDAVLVVEVSISTRDNDLATKSILYARAGIPEFWMVEPESRRLRVFREPRVDGTWASITVLESDGAAVSPLFAPQISLPLTELF
jgi:Uma2 family endonuclease